MSFLVTTMRRTLVRATLLTCAMGAASAALAQASSVPNRPTSPVRVFTGQVLDFGGRTIDGSAITTDGLFRCFNADRITIRNVTVVGSPRYAFLGRNCTNATIQNFRMVNLQRSAGGIRFDIAGKADGLQMSGIYGRNVGGHVVEVWNADGFNIEDVTGYYTGASALMLNNSRNGRVGVVTGSDNSPVAGYATFRVANGNGPNVVVQRVVSRNSARGFFSVSNSRGTTVNSVDIQGARADGIYIQDSFDTKVIGGASRGGANCRIRGGARNSITANCGGVILN